MNKYVCKVCGYIYDPAEGDGQPRCAGTRLRRCGRLGVPLCAVGKDEFEPA